MKRRFILAVCAVLGFAAAGTVYAQMYRYQPQMQYRPPVVQYQQQYHPPVQQQFIYPNAGATPMYPQQYQAPQYRPYYQPQNPPTFIYQAPAATPMYPTPQYGWGAPPIVYYYYR